MLNCRPVSLADARRIVIYRLGSIGDTVVSLPCFHRIAQFAPNAQRLVLTNTRQNPTAPSVRDVIDGSGLVHGFIDYPGGTRSITDMIGLRKVLRDLRADALIYLTEAPTFTRAIRDKFFFSLCGFRSIIGIPLSPHLRCNLPAGGAGEVERECFRLARCLNPLGFVDPTDISLWDLRLTADELNAGSLAIMAMQNKPFIAINMGGKAIENDWGVENWQNLLARLTDRFPDHGLLVVGSKLDLERAQYVSKTWMQTVVISCGVLSPRECAAALGGASAFVGHDSGPMHLANAMRVPCVGLFGWRNPPGRWHPIGVNNRPIHRMAGVMTISVDEVFRAVSELLMVQQVSEIMVSDSYC